MCIRDSPDTIRVAIEGAVLEVYQRKNELEEYKTYTTAAQKLQDEFRKDTTMAGHIPTLLECVEIIKGWRLVREGQTTGVSNTGGGKTITVVDPSKKTK